jgi:phage tail-like protein
MAQQAAFRLRITGPPGSPEIFDLPIGPTTIGREDDNQVVLRDDMVSRHHARIECTAAGACLIVDQHSTNGTLVNGARLAPGAPMPLAAGAVVLIGPFTLAVEQVPLAAPPPRVEAPAAPPPQPPPPPGPAPKRQDAPPPPPPAKQEAPPPDAGAGESAAELLPGLTLHSQRLLQYLPDIYQPPYDDGDAETPCFSNTDYSPKRFVSRFLGLFESILLPIEWTVANFDLFLDPGTTPAGFLSWLANWFEITYDESWTEQQRRTLVREAHRIYARRGTRWALSKMLEIYIGQSPEIVDNAAGQEPHTFAVTLPVADDPARRSSIEAIIDAHKPAHTTYSLRYQP